MKKSIIYLSILTLFASNVFCADNDQENSNIEKLKRNPGLYLNFQDVPIFYTGNPLEGLNTFAVLPPVSIQSLEVTKKIEAFIEASVMPLMEGCVAFPYRFPKSVNRATVLKVSYQIPDPLAKTGLKKVEKKYG